MTPIEKPIYEDKFIIIRYVYSKPKTKVYEVISKYSECKVGLIHWYPQWRHYTYEPIIEYKIELSDRCLLALAEFVYRMNKEHKENKK